MKDLLVEFGGTTYMDMPLDGEFAFTEEDGVLVAGEEGQTLPLGDGLLKSMDTFGYVDIYYIAKVCNTDPDAVVEGLRGSIYQNPQTWGKDPYEGWEMADVYLSGNLYQKYRAAVAENEETIFSNRFTSNIEALKRLLPATLDEKDIYITLGSPWVPTEYIAYFIMYLLDKYTLSSIHNILHDKTTGTWEITNKSHYRYSSLSSIVYSKYGTSRMGMLDIIEKTLNLQQIRIFDAVDAPDTKSGKRRVFNQQETILALEKQTQLVALFKDWVWQNPVRKKRLLDIYMAEFGSVKELQFDGSFLTYKNMNPNISLYPYQQNAVARIILTPNTLLAHEVGAGKTYVCIAAAMKMKEMNMAKRQLFVVPNNLVGQWDNIFHMLFPDANVLCVTSKEFTPKKRQETMMNILEKDYDGIIIAQSCFDSVELSNRGKANILQLEYNRLKNESLGNQTTWVLQRRMESLRVKIEELRAIPEEEEAADTTIYFDDWDIDRMYVDEAHYYKNVPLDSGMGFVAGMNMHGSVKCQNMLEKVKYIQQQNGGGGVVMATGTPITNSISDLYVFQQYLQSGTLELMGIYNFDAWVGMYAEPVTRFEIDVDTTNYRMVTRFNKFHNLPELSALVASIADFHMNDSTERELPKFDGYDDILIPKPKELEEYLQYISMRAEKVRAHEVKTKDDNMLKITTDGRKAALDIRLVRPECEPNFLSKVYQCAGNIARIYENTKDTLGVQLVFCDSSTPKPEFNMYDELKNLLRVYGIPEREIEYIHNATTEKKRESLFEKVRAGKIRILIGSTFKLGLGVNVQDKLIALHHLDIPWRPADMIQREGRIIRTGNTNDKVQIFRYITEGSFDAYSWQLLEMKQRFISDLLSGSIDAREGGEVDEVVLDYAEIKALAVGNPLIKERVEVSNYLQKLLMLQKMNAKEKERLSKEAEETQSRIPTVAERIALCQLDLERLQNELEEAEMESEKVAETKEDNPGVDPFFVNLVAVLQEHRFEPQDFFIGEYQGFELYVPAGMKPEKPYIWVKGHAKYRLEMSYSERGSKMRMDNFLKNLPQYVQELEENRDELIQKVIQIQTTISEKYDSYASEIEKTKKKLEVIDKKLGVDRNA